MQTIDVHEAGANLEVLVEAAAKGEPFLIAKEGKVLVRVSALDPVEMAQRKPLVLGSLAGKIKVPENFDRMFEAEIQAMFEGDSKL